MALLNRHDPDAPKSPPAPAKLSDAIIGAAGMLALLYLVPLLIFYVILPTDLPWPFYTWVSFAVVIVTLTWMLTYPLIVFRKRKSPRVFMTVRLSDIFREGAIALLAAIALVIFDVIVTSIWPGADQFVNDWEYLARSDYVALALFYACMSVLFGPVCEEVFYRGFLYSILRHKYGIVIACLAQSALFAATHLYSAFYVFIVFISGIALALLYQWRKTLLTPTLAHIWINLFVAIAMIVTMIDYANTPHLGIIMSPAENEIRIIDVLPDSSASDAGLQIDDVITRFDNKPVDHPGYLTLLVSEKLIGDTVTLTIIRDDLELELSATLGERP